MNWIPVSWWHLKALGNHSWEKASLLLVFGLPVRLQMEESGAQALMLRGTKMIALFGILGNARGVPGVKRQPPLRPSENMEIK